MIIMAIDCLDLNVLGPYLETTVEGFRGLQSAEKFLGGQSNPTFLLTAGSGQYVLRSQPLGKLLKSAHAVDREYRVIKALWETDVPVARAYHLCEDRGLIGSMFYIMSFEQGRIFWDPALPELDNAQRTSIYDETNRVLAALHDVDIEAVGLGDYGRPGNYFERQISRWSKQYRASEIKTIKAMDKLIEWLPTNIPEDDGKISLIHGDYRLDNIIFSPGETSARALLDWELSTLGHPYADLAYQCMQLRLGQDAVIAGLGNIDRNACGIPSEEEYVAQYCTRRRLDKIPHWDFYLVFSFFRFAAILQGVLKRAIDGNASSKKALDYGALAPKLADMAVKLIRHH
jgi:aminoglycoside phosphotransferase (APT) family kinase protein